MQLVGGPRCGQEIDPDYNGESFIVEQPIINYSLVEGDPASPMIRIMHYYVREGNRYVYKGVK